MADFPDLAVPSDDWVDIHTSLSITAGTSIVIQNTGNESVRLAEGDTKPTVTKTRGPLLFSGNGLQYQSDPDGSQKTWAISVSGSDGSFISVQT